MTLNLSADQSSNNIVFKKIWQEADLIEFEIMIETNSAHLRQKCYIQSDALMDIGNRIEEYSINGDTNLYVEFGNKGKEYTPGFSMLLYSADMHGHLRIELDIEIDDGSRDHRCQIYIYSELGMIQQLGGKLQHFSEESEKMCSLYELND